MGFDHQVIATGFEPVTVCLEGRCSIQLSYATMCRVAKLPVRRSETEVEATRPYCYSVLRSLSEEEPKYFKQKKSTYVDSFVGVAGFEPATSCSQSRRDNRATLHPDDSSFKSPNHLGKKE
jgi:hypothetical protein